MIQPKRWTRTERFLFLVLGSIALSYRGEATYFSIFVFNQIYQFHFLAHEEVDLTHQSKEINHHFFGPSFWQIGRRRPYPGLLKNKAPNNTPTFVVHKESSPVEN